MSKRRGNSMNDHMDLDSLSDISRLHSIDQQQQNDRTKLSQPISDEPEQEQDTRPPNLTILQRFITNWLIMDPVLLEKYQHTKTPRRNYQVQKSEDLIYIYLFGGRFRTIKAKPISLLTGLVIFAGGILFWVFEASWLWHHISPSLVITFTYLWLLTAMFYIKSCTSDPGIVPRNLHLPKTIQDGKIKNPPDEYFNTVSLPYKVKGEKVQVKYCSTCHIWRPPKTSHCGVCEVCILNHDHHCIYLNNCIGERNYKYFLWFLLFSTSSCVYMMILTMIHLCHYRLVANSEIHDFATSVVRYPASLFLFIYSFIAWIYPMGLLGFHTFLTGKNITTREYLNYVYKKNKKTNPFVNVFTSHSILKNLYINWLGKSSGVALVRPRDKYTPGDIRFEAIAPLDIYSSEISLEDL
ncbi:ERF2 [[Candida] subhashii]|uniref:Palmitoyltransferase n=1 Tax=[Candida] subhashii TaxID=561895 RepID=A0A8J5QH61_9ASCO|nr:ERF2 [[Candida] subhashii]KAG7661305.1 ERF2 [[Candida] subhashii]